MLYKLLLVTPVYMLVALFLVVSNVTNAKGNEYNALLAQSESELAESIKKDTDTALEGVPVKIYIPRLAITLDVADGVYDIPTQTWSLSKTNAHFASQTNVLSTKEDNGLSLIYGHNTQAVFAGTKDLQEGDIVEVTTDTGIIFSYKYVSEDVVSPDNTTIFDYTGKPRLSLLSCTGRWSESRRIMHFDLLSARKVS